jgi:hypothetical protein
LIRNKKCKDTNGGNGDKGEFKRDSPQRAQGYGAAGAVAHSQTIDIG